MKKGLGKLPSKSVKSLNTTEKDSSRILRQADLGKERGKKLSQDDDANRAKPLKQEMRNLDFLYTLLMQAAYANYRLELVGKTQEADANDQLYDRGKQLIELNKAVSSLRLETHARDKNKILDDVLSMEYSSLKSVEQDILVSAAYLKELEENSYSMLNRLNLNKGVVISPQDLSATLEKSAYSLKKISSLIEDESKEVEVLAKEFLDLIGVMKEQQEGLKEIDELQEKIRVLKNKEKIRAVERSIDARERLIKSLITEELNL